MRLFFYYLSAYLTLTFERLDQEFDSVVMTGVEILTVFGRLLESSWVTR